MIKEIYRFFLVGVINTLVGLFIIYICLYFAFDDLLANVCGYIVGLINAYFFNKYYVFRSKKKIVKSEVLQFIKVFILSYVLNLIVLYSCLNFEINSYMAQTFAMVTFSVTNFILNKFLTFKDRNEYLITKGTQCVTK